MRAKVGRRLAVMEARRNGQGRKRFVDLSRLGDDDLETLERLVLSRQAWPGSLDDWLSSLAIDEHED